MITRLNISMPEVLATRLRESVPKRGLSRFLAEAAFEKIRAMEREIALKELLEAPPTFKDIRNSAKYVRNIRKLDETRMKRLGI